MIGHDAETEITEQRSDVQRHHCVGDVGGSRSRVETGKVGESLDEAGRPVRSAPQSEDGDEGKPRSRPGGPPIFRTEQLSEA